jgi:thiol-disulfide isomerase/thioredoxin
MKFKYSFFLVIFLFLNTVKIVSQDISNLSFYTLEGKRITIKKENENQKKLFLINFARTDCSPCRKEIPELLSLHSKIQNDNFKVWIVFIEDENDKIQLMTEDLNLINKFPLFHDPMGTTKKKLKFNGYPYTILVKNNQIVYTSIGYTDGSISVTEKKIVQLLNLQ